MTELQKRKWTRLFQVYDADHDGVLELADFMAIAEGLAPGNETLRNLYAHDFGQILAATGAQPGTNVTTAQYLAFHEAMSAESYETMINGIANLVLTHFDADNDGMLTLSELKKVYAAFRVSDASPDDIFRRLDLNSDGYLSRPELLSALHEFFHSNDPEAPGNGLWGPY
jgi:Ca2+-binding EF-hand superfamily protein